MTAFIVCDHHTTRSFGASALREDADQSIKSGLEPGVKLSRAAS